MAIDDELDAIERIRDFEGITRSPVTNVLFSIGIGTIVPILNGFLPAYCQLPNAIAATAQGAIKYVYDNHKRKSDIFFAELKARLSKKRERIESGKLTLTEKHFEYIKSQFMPLVLEAHRRAQDARSEETLRRLAAIVANSVENIPEPDITEEMLRITMELSDLDVAVLGKLTQQQRDVSSFPDDGMPKSVEVTISWNPEAFKGICDQNSLHSTCLKVQSYGLVVSMPPVKSSATTLGLRAIRTEHPIFAVLKKGFDFVKYLGAA
jgi:hypothetical protein